MNQTRERALQATLKLHEGIREHYPSKVFALFSGGDDSLTVTRIASIHPAFSGVIHIDTGTGVPETRKFVEDTARRYGWPLQIYSPPAGTYERLVLDKGFPHGPKSHSTMYYHLKQRQIQAAIREHKQSRHDRIGFVAGIRIPESARRAKAKMSRWHYKDSERSAVWLQPILDWSKSDCLRFLEETGTPRNPVSVNCHRSGECLCGALANHAELEEMAFFYPEIRQKFSELSLECLLRGLPDSWAGGPTKRRRATPRNPGLPLCVSCELR